MKTRQLIAFGLEGCVWVLITEPALWEWSRVAGPTGGPVEIESDLIAATSSIQYRYVRMHKKIRSYGKLYVPFYVLVQ